MTNINRNYLTPLADRWAGKQFSYLLLNCPFTLLINDYKSNSTKLDRIRALVVRNNGFSYHPKRTLKISVLNELALMYTLGAINGSVFLAFFTNSQDAKNFLVDLKTENLDCSTYFSSLVQGHLVSTPNLDAFSSQKDNNFLISSSTHILLSKIMQYSTSMFNYQITNLILIINAYIQSISKRS